MLDCTFQLSLIRDDILTFTALSPLASNQPSSMLDPSIAHATRRLANPAAGQTLTIQGSTSTLTYEEATGKLVVTGPQGTVALEGRLDRDSGGKLRLIAVLDPDDRLYGGGMRTGAQDRRGRILEFWNTDPLPPHGEMTGAMYQAVPFYIRQRGTAFLGIFCDVAWRHVLDCGATDPAQLVLTTDGPSLTLHICTGPTLPEVIEQYTLLTGRMPPLPRWSLGSHQSRWSYMNEHEVMAVVEGYRAHDIPCDAVWLDIDYMRGFRDFTVDTERFPDLAGLVHTLHAQGFHLVTIIDPGLKVDPDYTVYQDGLEHGYYVRDTSGAPYEGWVWPGRSVWPDFLRSEVRAWWSEQHRPLLEAGVDGIWDDMNEPTQTGVSAPPDIQIPFGATLPPDTRFGPPAQPVTHPAVHNIYGLEMTHATREALLHFRPETRPFILTRATTAGGQRYAAVWNGDNTSIWEHLRMAIPLNLGVGLSGFPMTGCDIGGFFGDTTPELLVRFTQIGAFLPFCRNHSAMGTRSQEPWAFGEPYTSLCRAALRHRYELMPYLVTLAHEASETGAPLMRPLFWIAPDDSGSLASQDEFLLGNDLLIAPVVEEGATSRTVTLPPGDWFPWGDPAVIHGPTTLTIPVELATIPLYTRAGAVIPTMDALASTSVTPSTPLTFQVHLAAQGTVAQGAWYDDDDHPDAAVRGSYTRWHIEARWGDDGVQVSLTHQGGMLPLRFPAFAIRLHLPAAATVQQRYTTIVPDGSDHYTIAMQ